jgi:hypothetical protein
LEGGTVAVRKLYTVCATTDPRGHDGRFILGFTVARSDDEVRSVVRKHVKPSETFKVHMATTGGPRKPEIAKREAELFLDYGFDWLDPRGPACIDTAPVPDIVERLMTEGLALWCTAPPPRGVCSKKSRTRVRLTPPPG